MANRRLVNRPHPDWLLAIHTDCTQSLEFVLAADLLVRKNQGPRTQDSTTEIQNNFQKYNGLHQPGIEPRANQGLITLLEDVKSVNTRTFSFSRWKAGMLPLHH